MLHIQETCKIPSDRQVLLISGGEVLPPTARVCSYSAGTDTNPIYLFNLNLIESSHPPPPFIEQGLDIGKLTLNNYELTLVIVVNICRF